MRTSLTIKVSAYFTHRGGSREIQSESIGLCWGRVRQGSVGQTRTKEAVVYEDALTTAEQHVIKAVLVHVYTSHGERHSQGRRGDPTVSVGGVGKSRDAVEVKLVEVATVVRERGALRTHSSGAQQKK